MRVDDLFDVYYGTNLALNHLKKTKIGINFVSRTAKNNGVSAIVEPLSNVKPLDAGLITVAGGGSVMSSFVQPKLFYSGRDLYYLKTKKPMTLSEKLFYCMCLRMNHPKFSYGRQANRTLKSIELPKSIPNWVKNLKMLELDNISKSAIKKEIKLTDRKWKHFTYDYLFNIERGLGADKKDIITNGTTPIITAIGNNNGLIGFTNKDSKHKGNVITVVRVGDNVATAFYQPIPFCSTENIHVFNPKNFSLNKYIAMFLICLIRKQKIKYNYGRTWSIERMNKTTISVPVNAQSEPDWQFMENYIKSLPYSGNLQN